jgi:hypothetical protein
MAQFFISYRRDDAAAEAGRLYDLLCEQFGRDAVFMDVDTLRPGVNYASVIEQHLHGCQVLLAVIGRGWLNARGPEGGRRLDAPDDFVRREIESALSRAVTVIPVLVDGAQAPAESALPQTLRTLARLQAVALDTPEFRRDAEPLLATLAGAGGRPAVRRWAYWPALAALAIAVTVLGAMRFVHVDQVPVEIELRASQLGFTVAGRQPAVTALSVTRLGVSGLSEIALPATEFAPHTALLLEAVPPSGSISFPALVLADGSSVSFERGAAPGEVHVIVQAPAVDFQASVEGRVRIGLPEAPASTAEFTVPERVKFRARSNVVDLTALLSPAAATDLLREVKVSGLSFAAVEQTTLGDEPLVRTVSAIGDGVIRFWPGQGRELRVKAGDWLALGGVDGVLTSVAFQDGMFVTRFAGNARAIRLGPPGDQTSGMPTVLDAAWINYRAAMLIAAAGLVLATTVIIGRWRGGPS